MPLIERGQRQKDLPFSPIMQTKVRDFSVFGLNVCLANHDSFDRDTLDLGVSIDDLCAVEVDLDVFHLRRFLLQRDQSARLCRDLPRARAFERKRELRQATRWEPF